MTHRPEYDLIADRIITAEVAAQRAPDPGGSRVMANGREYRRRTFYRHFPVAWLDQDAELEEVTRFAVDIVAALRVLSFVPVVREEMLLLHLGPLIHLVTDEGRPTIRRFRAGPAAVSIRAIDHAAADLRVKEVVTLRSFLNLVPR